MADYFEEVEQLTVEQDQDELQTSTPDAYFDEIDKAITVDEQKQLDLEAKDFTAFSGGVADTMTFGAVDRFKSDDEKAEAEAIAKANPFASFFGSVAGMIPGAAIGAGLTTAATAGVGVTGSVARGITKSPFTRSLSASIFGASEGSIYAGFKGDSVLQGAAAGAIGGAGGQLLLGEALPALFRWGGNKVFNTGPSHDDYIRAKKDLKDRIMYAHPDLNEKGADNMIKALEELGPDAMLADIDDALYAMGVDLIGTRSSPNAAKKLTTNIKNRYEKAPEETRAAISSAIGDYTIFTPAVSKKHAKDGMKAYQPAYNKALKESSVSLEYDDLSDTIFNAFGTRTPDGGRLISNAATTKYNQMNKMLKRSLTSGGKPIPKNAKLNEYGDYVIKHKDLPDEVLDIDPIGGETIDAMRKEIDTMYKDVLDPFGEKAVNKGLSRDLAALRKTFTEELHSDKAFADVSKVYRDEHLYNSGYEMGQKAVSSKNVDMDALDIWMENATSVEVDAMLEGAKYELTQVIAEGGEEAFSKLLAKSTKLRAKLHSIFDDGGDTTIADTLIQSADNIAKFGPRDKKAQAIIDGSLANNQEASLARDIKLATLGLFTDRVSNTAATAATIRAQGGIDPRVGPTRDAAANLLATQGPEAASIFKDLFKPETFAGRADPTMFMGGLMEMAQPDE